MTRLEWLILGILAIRLALVRRRRGGLVAEALADFPLALPWFLLQDVRVFPPGAWSLLLPGGIPILVVLYGVLLLGAAITLAERLHDRLGRTFVRNAGPWGLAFIDLLVLAGVTAALESLLFHAGGWTYRFAGSLGSIPGAGIPWGVVIGAGGFGLFFTQAIRQYRRWAEDALGRLAVHQRAVLGLACPETGAVPGGGGDAGPGLRRAVGAAVFRLLDL